MEQNSPKDYIQGLLLTLSICLHALLLLGAYYLPLKQSIGASSGYSIVLSPVWNQQRSAAEVTPTEAQPANEQPPASTTEPQQVVQPTQTDPIPHQASEDASLEKITSPVPTSAKDSKAPQKEEKENEPIDERGLYKAHQDRQAGALLELAGWVWDTTPQPQDNTDESGKIVFEIKIDELGEVIAVRTLEKTVSTPVEKIYKDTLTELTFSRTADNTAYAPVYVGKVTFILRTK